MLVSLTFECIDLIAMLNIDHVKRQKANRIYANLESLNRTCIVDFIFWHNQSWYLLRYEYLWMISESCESNLLHIVEIRV